MAVLASTTTILLPSFLFVYFLYIIFKFIYKTCLNPIRIQNSMKSQGVNGPSYKFLYGNMKEIIDMRKDSMSKPMYLMSHNVFARILPHIYSWMKIYGENFVYWHGTQVQLVVTELELIKEILNNREDSFPKIDLEGYAKKLLGDGLSSSKGEKWFKMRKLANHVFHAESLKNMVPDMVTCVESMLEKWKKHEGKEIEVFEEFRLLASEIISRTAFGSSYIEGKNIFDMLMKLTSIVSRNAHKIRFPFLSWKSEDDLQSERLEQGIKDCIVQIITGREQKKNERLEENFTNDFLGKVLEANKGIDKSRGISIEDIVDECKTFYFAGHETTTSLLGWTVFLLAVNEEWQERARNEVFELIGKRTPNADDISSLKTLNMIIEESLRLYPPVPAIKRKVQKEVKLGKLKLLPQTELYISPLALHYDPGIWGEDVHYFRPERFAGGIVKATNNNPVAFMPFGFGPRTCVGLSFAINEAKITLSMILQRYRFTLSPSYSHSPVQVFMVRPQHGIQVILNRIWGD